MNDRAFRFPSDFRWGTATSAHQCEGLLANNDWAAWEAIPGNITDGTDSNRGCQWWKGRYEEDFDPCQVK